LSLSGKKMGRVREDRCTLTSMIYATGLMARISEDIRAEADRIIGNQDLAKISLLGAQISIQKGHNKQYRSG